MVESPTSGRAEGCTTTYYFDCTSVLSGGEEYNHCVYSGATTSCTPPDMFAPTDPSNPDAGAGASGKKKNLCPHPVLEGTFVDCSEYGCPGGFEVVEGFEDQGCQPVCGPGETRDEFGFCKDDSDCNVTSASIEEAFSEIDEADADTLAALINQYGKEFGIDNVSKLHHFLGQSNHEVGGFSNLHEEESMNYSVSNILLTFDKKFSLTGEEDGMLKAADYARNSEKLANYAYANRNGNGNEASGDGYKYRGRGLFHLTGRRNYKNFTNFYQERFNSTKDFENNPSEIASDKELAVLSALWYYNTEVMSRVNINNSTTIIDVTKKINPGLTGIESRKSRTQKAKDNIADCIEFRVN